MDLCWPVATMFACTLSTVCVVYVHSFVASSSLGAGEGPTDKGMCQLPPSLPVGMLIVQSAYASRTHFKTQQASSRLPPHRTPLESCWKCGKKATDIARKVCAVAVSSTAVTAAIITIWSLFWHVCLPACLAVFHCCLSLWVAKWQLKFTWRFALFTRTSTTTIIVSGTDIR